MTSRTKPRTVWMAQAFPNPPIALEATESLTCDGCIGQEDVNLCFQLPDCFSDDEFSRSVVYKLPEKK